MIHPSKISGRLGNQMFQIAFLYSQMKEGSIPDIFVQQYEYFEKYIDDIRQLFGEGIGYISPVAVHIRRGDYVGNPFYIDLTETKYYDLAISMFPEQTTFLVFSDDIQFAKGYLKKFDRKFTFSEGNDEIIDLNLMASCSSQIIANSSYSYWAGILNPNPGKTVIYPGEWFADGINRVTFPKEWIKI